MESLVEIIVRQKGRQKLQEGGGIARLHNNVGHSFSFLLACLLQDVREKISSAAAAAAVVAACHNFRLYRNLDIFHVWRNISNTADPSETWTISDFMSYTTKTKRQR
jgi:hypothetical protein